MFYNSVWAQINQKHSALPTYILAGNDVNLPWSDLCQVANEAPMYGIKDFWKKNHKVDNHKLVRFILIIEAFHTVFSLKA